MLSAIAERLTVELVAGELRSRLEEENLATVAGVADSDDSVAQVASSEPTPAPLGPIPG